MRQKLGILTIFLFFIISIHAQESGNNQEKRAKRNGGGKEGRGQGQGQRLRSPGLGSINVVAGAPTDQTVILSLITEKDAEAFIEYSTRPDQFSKRSASFSLTKLVPLEFKLEGLQKNTRYYYKVQYKAATETSFTSSAVSTFHTQRQSGGSFVFGVQGDSHPEREGKMFSSALYKQTIDSVIAAGPDLYFMMGDDFNIDRVLGTGPGYKQKIEPVYTLQRSYLGVPGKNPPLFLVNGNHEQAAKYLLDGTEDNPAVQAGLLRKKYFPLPAPGGIYSGDKDSIPHVGLARDYYAFEWGDALFVVLDPYWHSDVAVDNQPIGGDDRKRKDPWKITLGVDQYKWFQQVLEKSKSKFKFVFAHHVNGTGRGGVERAKFFEWGGYSQNGKWQFDSERPGWSLPIHQLMVKNKVTIFFQGHDHLFAHQELDGVIYQSVPNPADDTYTAFNKEAYTSGKVLPNSGFLKVQVDPKNVTVSYIRSFLPETANEPNDNYIYTIKK